MRDSTQRSSSPICAWSARHAVCLGMLLACANAATVAAEGNSDDGFVKSPTLADGRVAARYKAYPFSRPLLRGALRTYQRFVSPLRAGHCPMSPSCSRFALEAFDKANPLIAYLATGDRLHRCSHDLGFYTVVTGEDGKLHLDPPFSTGHPESAFLDDEGANRALTISFQAKDGSTGRLPGGESELLKFADQLHLDGALAEAAVEYRRFLSYYPASPSRAIAEMSLFRCYQDANLHLNAIHWGERLLQEPATAPTDRLDLKLGMGISFMKVGNGRRARPFLEDLAAEGELEQRNRAWLLHGFSLAQEEEWTAAKDSFAKVAGPVEIATRGRRLAELSDAGPRLPRKKPPLAGLLGIVPGLGYLYAGFPQTAAASFIVNGLFLAGTYKAFQNGNHALGSMLGIMSVGWYGGNIYGSVASAQRRNLKTKDGFLLRFELGFRY